MKATWNSDPIKHVQRVYELSLLSNLPLRLLLGKDARRYVGEHLAQLNHAVKGYGS